MSSSNMWDTRFGQEEYVYGREPNAFLAEHHLVFPKGARVLSLGEGEGRNAVFLGRQGYDVTALDSSAEGMRKLARLAAEGGVLVAQRLEDVTQADLGTSRWNGIVSIFCHLPSTDRQALYARIRQGLKPGGIFLTELFTPRQLAYQSGGPKDPDMLVERDELLKAFEGFEILLAEEEMVTLDEGPFHQGLGSVVRFIARRKD
jgi:SAM-dependent methyltransferase